MIKRTLYFTIPMERADGRQGWNLILSRHKKPGDVGELEFALHWGDKDAPTHSISLSLDEAREMFAELLHDDDATPL